MNNIEEIINKRISQINNSPCCKDKPEIHENIIQELEELKELLK